MSSTTPRRGRRAPTHEHTIRAVRTRVVVSSVYATVYSVTLARAPARAGAWARRAPRVPAWTVKASEISHSGRGYLEHPSQWRRALWPGLLLYHPLLPPPGVHAAYSHQARPEEAQEPSWGTANRALRPCCPAGRSSEMAAQPASPRHPRLGRRRRAWLGLG